MSEENLKSSLSINNIDLEEQLLNSDLKNSKSDSNDSNGSRTEIASRAFQKNASKTSDSNPLVLN